MSRPRPISISASTQLQLGSVDHNIDILRKISECFGARELYSNKQMTTDNFGDIIFDTLFAVIIDNKELRASTKYVGEIRKHLIRSLLMFNIFTITNIPPSLLYRLQIICFDNYIGKIIPNEITYQQKLTNCFYLTQFVPKESDNDLGHKDSLFRNPYFIILTHYMKNSGIMDDERFGVLPPVKKRKREEEDSLPNKSTKIDTPLNNS